MFANKNNLLIAGLVVVSALIAVWYFGGNLFSQSEPRIEYFALLEESASFAQAEEMFGKQECERAAPLYEQALVDVKNETQRGHVMFKIALCSYLTDDYVRAIPIFKDVGANPANKNFTRAYAVQYLGTSHYAYADAKIDEEIFRDEPYRSLWVEGDVRLSYRHLFEYASALYPLAISELRIAEWYAGELFLKTDMLSAEEKDRYHGVINAKIASAETDIARMRGVPGEAIGLPAVFNRKAMVLGTLAQLGDIPASEAEDAFKAVLAAYDERSSRLDGYARLYYAIFLARMYGAERAPDVRNILSKFYDTSIYNRNSF